MLSLEGCGVTESQTCMDEDSTTYPEAFPYLSSFTLKQQQITSQEAFGRSRIQYVQAQEMRHLLSKFIEAEALIREDSSEPVARSSPTPRARDDTAKAVLTRWLHDSTPSAVPHFSSPSLSPLPGSHTQSHSLLSPRPGNAAVPHATHQSSVVRHHLQQQQQQQHFSLSPAALGVPGLSFSTSQSSFGLSPRLSGGTESSIAEDAVALLLSARSARQQQLSARWCPQQQQQPHDDDVGKEKDDDADRNDEEVEFSQEEDHHHQQQQEQNLLDDCASLWSPRPAFLRPPGTLAGEGVTGVPLLAGIPPLPLRDSVLLGLVSASNASAATDDVAGRGSTGSALSVVSWPAAVGSVEEAKVSVAPTRRQARRAPVPGQSGLGLRNNADPNRINQVETLINGKKPKPTAKKPLPPHPSLPKTQGGISERRRRKGEVPPGDAKEQKTLTRAAATPGSGEPYPTPSTPRSTRATRAAAAVSIQRLDRTGQASRSANVVPLASPRTATSTSAVVPRGSTCATLGAAPSGPPALLMVPPLPLPGDTSTMTERGDATSACAAVFAGKLALETRGGSFRIPSRSHAVPVAVCYGERHAQLDTSDVDEAVIESDTNGEGEKTGGGDGGSPKRGGEPTIGGEGIPSPAPPPPPVSVLEESLARLRAATETAAQAGEKEQQQRGGGRRRRSVSASSVQSSRSRSRSQEVQCLLQGNTPLLSNRRSACSENDAPSLQPVPVIPQTLVGNECNGCSGSERSDGLAAVSLSSPPQHAPSCSCTSLSSAIGAEPKRSSLAVAALPAPRVGSGRRRRGEPSGEQPHHSTAVCAAASGAAPLRRPLSLEDIEKGLYRQGVPTADADSAGQARGRRTLSGEETGDTAGRLPAAAPIDASNEDDNDGDELPFFTVSPANAAVPVGPLLGNGIAVPSLSLQGNGVATTTAGWCDAHEGKSRQEENSSKVKVLHPPSPAPNVVPCSRATKGLEWELELQPDEQLQQQNNNNRLHTLLGANAKKEGVGEAEEEEEEEETEEEKAFATLLWKSAVLPGSAEPIQGKEHALEVAPQAAGMEQDVKAVVNHHTLRMETESQQGNGKAGKEVHPTNVSDVDVQTSIDSLHWFPDDFFVLPGQQKVVRQVVMAALRVLVVLIVFCVGYLFSNV